MRKGHESDVSGEGTRSHDVTKHSPEKRPIRRVKREPGRQEDVTRANRREQSDAASRIDEIHRQIERPSSGRAVPQESVREETMPDLDREEQAREETYRWYLRARDRARELIRDIDPDLVVEVQGTDVALLSGGLKENEIVLAFHHKTNPRIRWTQWISKNEAYLKTGLEKSIRRTYTQQYQRTPSDWERLTRWFASIFGRAKRK